MNIKTVILIAAAAGLFWFFFMRSDIASSAQVQAWVDGGALVVDVRTQAEYAAVNYKGAVNIPLADIESRIDEFGDKEGRIVLYCRTGNRSGQAKRILEKNGFKNVINAGGLNQMGL